MFRRVGRTTDGLCHFLRCRWKISLIRVDSRQRQVADPVAWIFLGNLGIQLEGALRISLPLQAPGINIELHGVGLFNRGCQRFRGVVFPAPGIEDPRFRFSIPTWKPFKRACRNGPSGFGCSRNACAYFKFQNEGSGFTNSNPASQASWLRQTT